MIFDFSSQLPGRTDNEIKNYWNTPIKRRQRSGLPLYPPEVCFQAMNGGQQDQNFSELASGDAQQHSLLQTNGYDIPDVVFDNLKVSHGHLSYAPAFPHISRSGILFQGASSQNYNVVLPSVHEPKQPQESEAFYPGFLGSVTNGLPTFLPLQNDSFSKIHPSHGLGFTYDPDPNKKNPTPYGGAVTGSHALLNGNLSTSKPFSRAVKLELPSLQYPETDLNSWGTCPAPLSSLETVVAYIQFPALQVLSDYSPPWNSGLLDEVVHRPHGKNQTSESSSSSSIVTLADVIDSSTLNLNGTEWEDLGGPVSSLGCSAASAFSECTPVGGSSLDKSQPAKEELAVSSDSDITTETAEGVAMLDGGEDISMQLDFLRPDALLGADCFQQSSDYAKDLAALLSEDFCNDYKHVASWTSSQGCTLGTYPWNNMPAACHMPELP